MQTSSCEQIQNPLIILTPLLSIDINLKSFRQKLYYPKGFMPNMLQSYPITVDRVVKVISLWSWTVNYIQLIKRYLIIVQGST